MTEGKGIMVLVVNENDAAADATGIWPAAKIRVHDIQRKQGVNNRIVEVSMITREPARSRYIAVLTFK